MNEFLTSGQSVDRRKYRRLMAITLLDLVLHLPQTIVNLCISIFEDKSDHIPYTSWTSVHRLYGSFNTILQDPASLWSMYVYTFYSTKFNEWAPVLNALVFFLVFGTTTELCAMYFSFFASIATHLGFKVDLKASHRASMPEMRFGPAPAIVVGYVHSSYTGLSTFAHALVAVARSVVRCPRAIELEAPLRTTSQLCM